MAIAALAGEASAQPGPEISLSASTYCFYSNDSLQVFRFSSDSGLTKPVYQSFAMSRQQALPVSFVHQHQHIQLSSKLTHNYPIEKHSYNKPAQLFAVSDIEGNLPALIALLKSGGVINDQWHWTFGKGHLVFTGDFVDRGSQVLEVLWFVYALEEQALAAGGKVHFILGNHEVMNLAGDSTYVHPLYLHQTQQLHKNYAAIFGEQSVLGRWLVAKNIVEKIGPFLFLHAGISPYTNAMQASVQQLNQLARPLYRDTTGEGPNLESTIVMSEIGPYWYRGYYTGTQKATQATIDSTLSLFGVKYIVTGHTIVANQITRHFNNKVINIDVHHAGGHSEGLLWKDDQFYRVLPNGDRIPL